jgi:hypothetical protein
MTYILGKTVSTNLKTEKGTVVHKVLEILAGLKLAYQNTGKYEYEDENIGKVKCTKDNFLKLETLSDEAVEAINKSMINKDTYIDQPRIKYGHQRYGVKIVEEIIQRSFDYYKDKSNHSWGKTDFKDCTNFTWLALDHNGGDFDPRKRTIVSPEQSFNFIIEEDWAKLPDGGYLGLKGTIDLTTEIDDETIEIIDWKGLPIETVIPTPNGWSTMGELNVGDTVFDKDGIPSKILGKSKVKNKPCYKITFDDKTEVICDNEHLWKLHDGRVLSIMELKIQDKISVNKAILTEEKILPIDPYVLGLWLGDGRNKNGEISNSDEFIFEEILRRGYSLGDNINKNGTCPSKTVMGLVTNLKKLNLLNNKHIPEIYLRASYNQRLDLLRGLMDSDGNVNSIRKQAVFTNCNKNLSDDVKKLLITLGQRVNQATVNRNTNFKDNIVIYPLAFRPIDINPFLLPRKANKVLNWGYGRSNYRIVKNIESIENKLTQCISVDSPTNTYLCTENMIPTHNTGQRKNWATGEKKSFEHLQKDKQLMLYYYAAKKAFPKYKHVMITIFFIRDGGPFTVCFDDDKIVEIKEHLAKTKIEIENCSNPKLLDPSHKDFRCKYLCTYFKNKVGKSCYCDYIKDEIKVYGLEETTKKHREDGFSIGYYANPGGA